MGSTPAKAIHKAAEKGDTAQIDLAIRQGADINEIRNGRTPLISAARKNSTNAVRFLLQHGASDYRDGDHETALHQ